MGENGMTGVTADGVERVDTLVLGSGEAGKSIAWAVAAAGRRAAVVERRYVGGSCPNIACLPSKNVVHSAKVAHLLRHHDDFGLRLGDWTVDMAGVRDRKRRMVDGLVGLHRAKFRADRGRAGHGRRPAGRRPDGGGDGGRRRRAAAAGRAAGAEPGVPGHDRRHARAGRVRPR